MDFDLSKKFPESWKRHSIEEVCSRITSGGTPSRRDHTFFAGGTIPWVKTQELQNGWIINTEEKITEEALKQSSAKLLPKNTVLLAMYGATVGQLGILATPMACNQACCALIVNSKIANFRYLFYLLNFHKNTIKALSTGAAQQNLSATQIKKFTFTFPDTKTQNRIAYILGSLDDKIELNRKTNETLETMARTLFQAWFVDFEPVRAKMEGRWKRGQSLPGLPAHLYDLFPDRLVGSDERESPDGWIFGQLSSICNLNPESWTKRNRPQSIHYIDLSSTKLGRIEQISEYKIDNAPSRAQRILLKNDTILGTVRPENCSYALVHDNGLTGSTGFAVLRPKKPIYTEIVYLSATSQSNIDRLSALADGAAYPAVRPEVVLETIIPQIPDELIIEFSKTTNPLLTSIAENEKMSRTLSQLRDTLLPRLMSGELRIPDAERIAGEAL